MEHSTSTSSTSESARGLMDRVRTGATAQLSTQKDRATDGLGSLAQAVRQSTQPFRDNNQETIAQYIEQAANQLEQFSTTLRHRDVGEIMGDVQQFARRQPAMFIGAAFTAGLLAARFMKSSSRNRQFDGGQSYGGQSYGGSQGSYPGRSTFATESHNTPQYAGGGL